MDPLTGNIAETVTAPCDGLLFTLREYPLVFGGSLLARILEYKKND
jgi:predicted deacylase